MATAGLACLTGASTDPLVPSEINLIGVVSGLAGGAAFGLITVLSRVLVRRSAPPLSVTAVGFLFGAGFLLPFAMADGVQVLGNGSSWPVLLYLGAIPSALAYLLYAYGIQRLRTAAAGAASTLVEPAAAVGLACLILGERLDLTDWAGAMLLLLALALLFRCERAGESSGQAQPN